MVIGENLFTAINTPGKAANGNVKAVAALTEEWPADCIKTVPIGGECIDPDP